jgi:hypothetical protein
MLLRRNNELLMGENLTLNIPAKKVMQCWTEIRELDGERQSLVYNHHHELIAASDTIAAVCQGKPHPTITDLVV